jgi:hypothetical protein
MQMLLTNYTTQDRAAFQKLPRLRFCLKADLWTPNRASVEYLETPRAPVLRQTDVCRAVLQATGAKQEACSPDCTRRPFVVVDDPRNGTLRGKIHAAPGCALHVGTLPVALPR